MYQIGEFVVKLSSGVCQVVDIVHLDFVKDKKREYYQLMPISDKNAKLYVPVDNSEATMRRVMTYEEAIGLIESIPKIDATWLKNEKERKNCYKDAMQSNDPKQLIGIIKLIYHRNLSRQEQGKKTTAVDEQYFQLAEELLYSELELVMKKEKSEILSLIKESCEK